MKTTVIGSFPYDVSTPNWFNKKEDISGLATHLSTKQYTKYIDNPPNNYKQILDQKITETLEIQEKIGIDVFTNGEIGRENYIHFIMRNWGGVDFNKLEKKTLRNNAYSCKLPVIRSKLSINKMIAKQDWLRSSKKVKDPSKLKYTLPGPMTIYDTIVDRYYDSPIQCMNDIAKIINMEMLDLQKGGCSHIQLDEPVFARYPEKVLLYGNNLLDRCFEGIVVHKSLHICRGYPDKLEHTNYLKADKNSYIKIADLLDNSIVDSISIEDAHRNNDLEKLLGLFKNKIIILGVIKIATVSIESVDYITNRINEALNYINYNRLWISPDCGLGMLPIDIAIKKLKVMSDAANIVKKSFLKS